MSQAVPSEIDVEGAYLKFVDAVQSRKTVSSLVTDLQMKGGEGPNLWFPKDAFILPVYIVGADSSVSLSTTAPSVAVVRTSQADTHVVAGVANKYGTAMRVPDGADKIIVQVVCSAFTGSLAADQIGWQGSDDGVNFTPSGAAVNDSFNWTPAAVGDADDTWTTNPTQVDTMVVSRGLPRWVRACFISNNAANNFSVVCTVTVS